MTHFTVLFSELFLIVGFVGGWIASERYHDFMEKEAHPHDELFKENPHPELYDSEGELFRGEYVSLNFEPGYDPEEFDPEDLYESP